MSRFPTFKQALRRHAMLAEPVKQYQAEDFASEVWCAITRGSSGDVAACAVEDTVPSEYAVLLTVEDIPAAFAVACHVRAFAGERPTDPYRCRELARRGWEEFRHIADAAGDRQRGTGCDLSDAWPLFKQFTDEGCFDQDRLREIADLAGRMLVSLRGATERRVKNRPDEVVGTRQGSDVRDLIPSEMGRLAHPTLRTELIHRLVKDDAVCLRREGKEKTARGPMVFLLDESGSMEGDRDTWAKGAMTALTRMAWKDKRPCAVVHFSTATKVHKLMPNDHKALLRAQSLFLDGGTHMGNAIRIGLDTVQELAREGIQGADLVLISDGKVPDAQVTGPISEMEKAGIRMWTVAIGQRFREDSPLRTRAASYQEINDETLKDASSVNGLASTVAP